jgi:hypothetical protein
LVTDRRRRPSTFQVRAHDRADNDRTSGGPWSFVTVIAGSASTGLSSDPHRRVGQHRAVERSATSPRHHVADLAHPRRQILLIRAWIGSRPKAESSGMKTLPFRAPAGGRQIVRRPWRQSGRRM